MWMARTDQLGSAIPSATGFQTRQGCQQLDSNAGIIGIAIRDNSFSVDLQRISGILQDFATSLTVGATFPRRFALVLCSPATAYKHGRALAAQFTSVKQHDQPADCARGLS